MDRRLPFALVLLAAASLVATTADLGSSEQSPRTAQTREGGRGRGEPRTRVDVPVEPKAPPSVKEGEVWLPPMPSMESVAPPPGWTPSGEEEPPMPLTLARLTRDVSELMDHLGIQRAHFVGVSGGGYLAQQLAIHDPERVLSLVLLASRPGFKDSKGAAWIPEMERRGLRTFIADTIADRLPVGEVTQAQVDWFLDEIARNDPAFVRRFVLYMTTQYWMDDLAKVRCPTLIVAPRGDAIGNANAYQQMHKLIRDSELVTYDVESHNIADYLADRCAEDAMAFLSRRFPS